MKNEILQRAMFAMPLTKDSRNSGIMAGFEDEMPEAPEDGSEEMPQMARTPQNPEILMNTLRGDMRSVDARYQELAQMVGEEAAMETPPEVLAMLMGQMGAQQGGIGALPQGQEMAPPPMGMPPEGGMPPEAGMPPQGGIPMPPGMEGAGPFPQGGAEQAPPTPDGMPPMTAAFGAFVTPATRMAQMAGNKIGQVGSAANAALGRMFMTPQGISQPILENVRGPAGRYTAEQVVTGGQALTAPTFTQGVMQGTAKLADQYPRLASMLAPAAGALGLANAPRGGSSGPGTDLMSQIPTDTIEDRVANSVLNKPPILSMSLDQPFTTTDPDRVKITTGPRPTPAVEAPAPASAAAQMAAMEPVRPDEFGTLADVGDEKKSTQDFIKAAVKEKTRGERIKEGYAELAPLFQEILGSDKEDMKTNALLMLADAGFKMASSRQPTAAMAIAEGFAGVPKGFMALAAQSKDRDLKIKSTALSQAFSDVQEQDKYAQQLKMEVLKGDFRILLEQAKNAVGGGSVITKDGGGGLRIAETKNGSFIGASVDPKDPTVQSAIQSRFTLRDTDNPFVENRGEAPTTVETDKGERIKLTSTLRALDNSLSTLDNLKGTYTSLYSPGTWFQDKVNNLIVPIDPTGLVRPDVNQADAATRIQTGLNSVLKNIASANDGGRVAVQEQEWVRDNAKGISSPTAFFQNKELAAKGFASTEAMLRNARQQVLTQLGYESNDYAMRTPNTGTQNDPFVIPAEKDGQRVMFNFLGSTIGKLQDPKATVFIKMPNNTIQQFNPTQLRGLIGNQ
jgi:hypothetical protein